MESDLSKLPHAVQQLGLVVKEFAGPSLLKNPTSFSLTDGQTVYVTETHRWMNGVEDDRQNTAWLMEDLACQTVEDRAKKLAKYEPTKGQGYFTKATDRVVKLIDENGDGTADQVKEWATDFRESVDGPAIGLLQADDGSMLLANVPHLWRLRDENKDEVAEKREKILSGFGVKTSFAGHDLHGLTYGPDGKLYFSIGDRGFHVKTKEDTVVADPNRGVIFRCDPDGAHLEIFYQGLRNPQEIAFNEYGDLFTVDNNSDQGDKARVLYLIEGGDGGWTVGHQMLTTFKSILEEGGYKLKPTWLSEKLWEKPHADQPKWVQPPLEHLTNGPSGMIYTSGLSLPERYRQSFFITDYKGAPEQSGIWSFKVEPRGAGYEVKDAHLFWSGVPNVDVDFSTDGRMFVLDYGGGWQRPDAGRIYTISDPQASQQPVVKQAHQLLTTDQAQFSTKDLLSQLHHADYRVRLRAQFALVKRGPEHIQALHAEAKAEARHAVWALRQLGAVEPLRALLTHESADIVGQSARALGELKDQTSAPMLARLLAHSQPRVRAYAAIALGKLTAHKFFPEIVDYISREGASDAAARHAGVMALRGATPEQIIGLAQHSVRDVRLAAVLSLRHQRHAGVQQFLRDGDLTVAGEAVRAINDVPIVEAMPALAHEARRFVGQNRPELYQSLPQYARLLRACLVVGGAEEAALLAELAMNPTLSETERQMALRTLSLIPSGVVADFTTGEYRPVLARPAAPLAEVLRPKINQIFTKAPSSVIAAALPVARAFDIPVSEDHLFAWAGDKNLTTSLRLAATANLSVDRLASLLTVSNVEVRNEAAKRQVALQPATIEATVRTLWQQGADRDLRTTYALLAKSDQPVAVKLLLAESDRWLANQLPKEVKLDFYEALASRPEKELQEKLAAIDAKLAAEKQTMFDLAIVGGDASNGREVFINQGTCLKCHLLNGEGGSAGPSLDHVAQRLSPEKLLSSLVNPNAEITEGYGISSVVMKDGHIHAGSIVEEDVKSLKLKTPLGEVITIDKEKIVQTTPPMSPMPPMGLTLTKQDLRDLLAYMQSLK